MYAFRQATCLDTATYIVTRVTPDLSQPIGQLIFLVNWPLFSERKSLFNSVSGPISKTSMFDTK